MTQNPPTTRGTPTGPAPSCAPSPPSSTPSRDTCRPSPGAAPDAENPVGLGRNCTIFETARIWAYRDARRIRQRHEYATPEDSTALLRIVTERVNDLNNEFSEPLPASETKAIATSIRRWITTRFYGWTDARTVNQTTFSAIQSARGRRARPARRAASEALWEGA